MQGHISLDMGKRKHDKMVVVRMPSGLYEDVERLAKLRRVRPSEMLRRLLGDGVEMSKGFTYDRVGENRT